MNEEKDVTNEELAEAPSLDTEPLDPPTEEPLGEEPPKKKNDRTLMHHVFDVLEMFAWAVFVVILVFTFVVRLCRVDGESMENTLRNDQKLLIYNLGYTPSRNDIVVFHLTRPEDQMEKTYVKRVIATEGETVRINWRTGEIFIDDKPYNDLFATLKNPDGKYEFPLGQNYDGDTLCVTVPKGHVFVMGDNRNNSFDSRYELMGCIDTRCILGKAVVRLAPFTVYS